MNEYHKIQTIFKRDPQTNHKGLLIGEFSLKEFEFLQNNEWVFTEKVDGTNIRVKYNAAISEVSFGGKTDNAQIPGKLVTRLQQRFPLEKIQEVFNDPDPDLRVCLYGEGYGPNIQAGGNYRSDQDFVLFDVKVGDWWLQRSDVEDVAKRLELDVVPVLGTGTLEDMISMCRKGFNSTWGEFEAEGLVARPAVELKTRSGDRIITKLKCRDFKV